MTAEPDFQAELAKVSQAVATSLASVQAAAGPERAALAASIMVRVAVGFTLDNLGEAASGRDVTRSPRGDRVAQWRLSDSLVVGPHNCPVAADSGKSPPTALLCPYKTISPNSDHSGSDSNAARALPLRKATI